jgi:chemotaxis regulatin CheY-phosphate phosphatase CheZ
MPAKSTDMPDKIRQELGELTLSISKMMDMFRQIRQPIQESSEKVPATSHQLERVTEQTEEATHKVLDTVEIITNRESEISDSIKQLIKIIPDNVLTSVPNLGELLEKIHINSEANLNDTMVIMEALQFQDITSQQIEHAVSQLEDVDIKLKTLLVATGLTKGQGPIAPKKARAFDPNANYASDHQNHQQEVDDLISNMNKNT